MKPADWSTVMKPEPRALAMTATATVITALLLLVSWNLLDRSEERMHAFGNSTVTALGALCVEPLLKQDLLHLGVISNRLLEMEAVTAVATYTADEQLLTLNGVMAEPLYTETLRLDGNVVGHVRIALDPAAFRTGIMHPAHRSMTLWLGAASLLLAMVGAVLIVGGVRGWRAGLVKAPRLPERRASATTTDVVEELAPDEIAPDVRHYLLGVNLYNQFTLKGVEREFELSLCTELAEAVAEAFSGQVVSLPGLGALIDFDDTDAPDRPFEIVTAGLTLARLLRDEAPFGIYRLGAHAVLQPGDAPLPVDHPAVADVTLLSALARDHTLVLSETLAESVDRRERMVARAMSNLMLSELTTCGPGAALVTELAPEEQLALIQRVEAMKAQRDASESESTF